MRSKAVFHNFLCFMCRLSFSLVAVWFYVFCWQKTIEETVVSYSNQTRWNRRPTILTMRLYARLVVVKFNWFFDLSGWGLLERNSVVFCWATENWMLNFFFLIFHFISFRLWCQNTEFPSTDHFIYVHIHLQWPIRNPNKTKSIAMHSNHNAQF